MPRVHRIGRRRFLGLVAGAAAGGSAVLSLNGRFQSWLAPREARAAAGSDFDIDAATAARVLNEACRYGAPAAELFLEIRTVTNLTMAESQIESVEQGILAGCGVRAIDGERTGYAYADSFEPAQLLDAARNAAAIAADPASAVGELTFTPQIPVPVVGFARSFDDVANDERVAWLNRADRVAREYDPAVKQVTVNYTDEMRHFAVINSDGLWVEDTLPLLYMRFDITAAKNGQLARGTARFSHRLGAEQMDANAASQGAEQAARMAVVMCEAREAPTGEMPVVLAAGGGVMFHEAVGHGLEGDYVRRGTSTFAGRVGELVASERVSVIDAGDIPELRGSFNVDDEGTPPRHNTLIEKGVLRGFMTDRIAAAQLGIERSGNGRRQSYRFPPLVRMTNTFLAAGYDDVEEIIASTRSGIYAATFGGGEVDPITGNFTFGLREAYRIEDGKLGAPVRGANLVGNGPEIMQRIDRVGPDLEYGNGTCGKGQWVPVTSGAPTLRIASMTVGGSA